MDEIEIVERLANVENRAKSNTHRIDEIEKDRRELNQSMNRMATAVETLANEQKYAAEEQRKATARVEKLDEKVSGLELAPAKRAESLRNKIIETLITLVLGAVVGAIFALILK